MGASEVNNCEIMESNFSATKRQQEQRRMQQQSTSNSDQTGGMRMKILGKMWEKLKNSEDIEFGEEEINKDYFE
ncbi:hypothetical protein PPACK8108_LOCUS13742 [Phakopsora pachyrhizi]|uniref:Uncharacterized protein n=1 Tax=Phakopsora pachyrhizi TaxID=170000 RepID=A0AAV0B7L6_PHAPC|nr:hypothetical protein PPACK8108_LOCUS13742 [Phakopsora pachyrhizi]